MEIFFLLMTFHLLGVSGINEVVKEHTYTQRERKKGGERD